MSKFSFRYPARMERNFKIVQLGRPDYFRAGLACPATPLATPLQSRLTNSNFDDFSSFLDIFFYFIQFSHFFFYPDSKFFNFFTLIWFFFSHWFKSLSKSNFSAGCFEFELVSVDCIFYYGYSFKVFKLNRI